MPQCARGVSLGYYLVLAALNQVVAPRSQAPIGAWYDQTWLRRHWGIPATAFTSQTFWRALEAVDADALAAIEDAVAAAAVSRFEVPVTTLVYDATNVFTDLARRRPARSPSGAITSRSATTSTR